MNEATNKYKGLLYFTSVQHTVCGPQYQARHFYPVSEVSLILSQFNRHLLVVNICCRNVKNDRFVSIRYVFQALKYAKTRFAGVPPRTLLGPRSPSHLGRGTPLPIPFPPRRLRHLDLGTSVVWPPTSLKFVHLSIQSKRLDTPAISPS